MTELRNIDFPLVFKFCVRDIKKTEKFKKLGYDNSYDVFTGKSKFNESLFGWNGHTKNFSTIEKSEKNYQIDFHQSKKYKPL